MYAAVLFDLDNTLIDRDAALRGLIRAAFPSRSDVMDELIALDRGGYGDRRELLRRWSELGGEPIDARGFGLALARFVRVQAGLLQELKRLAETTPLAIISNGGAAAQLAKWRAAGLDAVIPRERLWISEAVGLRKPDPAIFRLSCSSLNVAPADCLYVGDQPRIDIAGAVAAGMPALLTTAPLTPIDVRRLHDFVPTWMPSRSPGLELRR